MRNILSYVAAAFMALAVSFSLFSCGPTPVDPDDPTNPDNPTNPDTVVTPPVEIPGVTDGDFSGEPGATALNLTMDAFIKASCFGEVYKNSCHEVRLQFWNTVEQSSANIIIYVDAKHAGAISGTYTFSDTRTAGTALYSGGKVGGVDAPSYVLDAAQKPYYIRSGSMTINGNKITISAKSKNGSTINVTCEADIPSIQCPR